MSLTLPSFERFEEASQIRRSSKRVVANIIEGHAQRKYKPLYLTYLYRALGSCEETEGHLRLLHKTGSLPDAALFEALSASCSELSRRLFRVIQVIERRYDTPHFLGEFDPSSWSLPSDHVWSRSSWLAAVNGDL